MNTRIIKTAGALLLGILMITSVNAQNRQGVRGLSPRASGDGPAYGKTAMFARLDLSEEQQKEITSLRTEHYKEITPLRNKMAELRARKRTLLSEESVDMKAVNKNIDEQTDLMNTMKKLQTMHQIDMKSHLTDEQVMQLQQRRQFARRNGMHIKGGQRGNNNFGAAGTGRGYRGI